MGYQEDNNNNNNEQSEKLPLIDIEDQLATTPGGDCQAAINVKQEEEVPKVPTKVLLPPMVGSVILLILAQIGSFFAFGGSIVSPLSGLLAIPLVGVIALVSRRYVFNLIFFIICVAFYFTIAFFLCLITMFVITQYNVISGLTSFGVSILILLILSVLMRYYARYLRYLKANRSSEKCCIFRKKCKKTITSEAPKQSSPSKPVYQTIPDGNQQPTSSQYPGLYRPAYPTFNTNSLYPNLQNGQPYQIYYVPNNVNNNNNNNNSSNNGVISVPPQQYYVPYYYSYQQPPIQQQQQVSQPQQQQNQPPKQSKETELID